jgi:universal stress protein A
MAAPMGKLFSTILCPVSFDANSAAALDLARDLAEGTDAVVYLIHVVAAPPIGSAPIPMEPFPQSEHDARTALQQLALSHLEGRVRYELIARSGDPAGVIIDAAREFGADSIVMATHARKGISHLLLGSVAERVVREAPCPVLTIRPS